MHLPHILEQALPVADVNMLHVLPMTFILIQRPIHVLYEF